MLVRGGFDAVPTFLARGLDVRLAAPVQRLTADGAVEAGGVRADAAVVAVPLALLQRDSPALPAAGAVRDDLNLLTTGTLEKVFLRYARRWWPARQVLQIAGTPGQRWSEWYDLERLVGAPVLFGFCGGRSSGTRPADDAAAARQAARVLQRAYG
jgi:monoamine oxidase